MRLLNFQAFQKNSKIPKCQNIDLNLEVPWSIKTLREMTAEDFSDNSI